MASVSELLDRGCDLVVEAAGHAALRQYGVTVLESGADLVVLSAGSLAEEATERTIRGAGRGCVLISTGAAGGLDILRTMAQTGELEEISIRTTATPPAFDGMSEMCETIGSLIASGEPTTLLAGSARSVALRFPTLANVAATVALATLGLDDAQAEMRLDPSGQRKRHESKAVSANSRVHIEIDNIVSRANPRTSAVTPHAVLRLLSDRVQPFLSGV